MNQTQALLARVKAHLGNVSSYRAAEKIGVSRQAVSQWEHGKTFMTFDNATRAAELLGEDPAHVMALIALDQTKGETAKKTWLKIAQTYAAALVLIALIPHVSQASEIVKPDPSARSLYLMLNHGCGF